MAKTRRIIEGAIGIVIGFIITGMGLCAAYGGFQGTTWEIMGRVIQPSEWGWYLAIIGIIVLFIGIVITYFGFKKTDGSAKP